MDERIERSLKRLHDNRRTAEEHLHTLSKVSLMNAFRGRHSFSDLLKVKKFKKYWSGYREGILLGISELQKLKLDSRRI